MIIRSILLFCCCFGFLEGQKKKDRHFDYADCGKRYGSANGPVNLGVTNTDPGKFPWHVGIYKYDRISEMYENVCGGTIVSPHIVITAAACVYNTANRSTYKPTFFKVVAGKTAFAWSTPDNNAQEVNVNDIAIPDTFLGDINSYAENVAVINLAKDLYLNELVHPICFDLENRGGSAPDRIVQTAGWGFKGDIRYSHTLKEASFRYINIVECRKKYSSIRYLRFINYDKMCVLTPEGRRDHDTGGGLVYRKGDKYHLLGVMSAFINNEFTPSTNLSKHLQWLKGTVDQFEKAKRCKDTYHCLDGTCLEEVLVCDGTKDCPDGSDEMNEVCSVGKFENIAKNSCLLPIQPGGVSYTKQFCEADCELKGGVYVAPNGQVHINCGQGFGPKETERKALYICSEGRWFPEDPKCIRLCSGLKKRNLHFNCTYKSDPVRCDTFMRPGTVASYYCSQHYRIVDAAAFSGFTICLDDGTWNEALPTCSPECGIENPANLVQLTVVGGNVSKHGKYPWHTAVYRYVEYNKTFVNICGGTLIHEHFILTAAHCMFHLTGARVVETELKVALGKFYRTWDVYEDNQQTSGVKNILIPEAYGGNPVHYEQDIALLNTDKIFVYSDFVLPACMDFARQVAFPSNSLGTMVGWGMTETLEYSDELKEVHLPIISTVACRKKYRDFTAFITSDKLCVIYRNGSGIQEGDSGGGMTLKLNEHHFVYGIVSVKQRNVNLFAALTNVSVHRDWIRRSMQTYIRRQ